MPPVPYYGMVADGVGYVCFDRFVDGCSRDDAPSRGRL